MILRLSKESVTSVRNIVGWNASHHAALPLLHPYRIELLFVSKIVNGHTTIKALLGHKNISTIMVSTHILQQGGQGIIRPLDYLAQMPCMVSWLYRIHGNYQLVERRTGIIEVILRVFTIKIWDKQGEWYFTWREGFRAQGTRHKGWNLHIKDWGYPLDSSTYNIWYIYTVWHLLRLKLMSLLPQNSKMITPALYTQGWWVKWTEITISVVRV